MTTDNQHNIPEQPAPASPETRAVIEKTIRSFPALPSFVNQVIDLLNNPHAEIQDITDHIKFDPGMTANILKLANSAMFGAQRSVQSLHAAIVRLGLKQIFQLVTAAGISKKMTKAMPGYDLRPEELLSHSVWAAVASEELCHALNMTIPDILFTAGLLHDMGKIILDPHLVQHRDAICRLAAEQDLSFQIAEEQVLGINHSEAGAILLDHWHFPGELIAAARWHHEPQQATEHETTVRIVHIADALAYSEGLGCGIDGMMYKLSPDTISLLGLTKKALEYAASQTLDKMQQIEKLLAE